MACNDKQRPFHMAVIARRGYDVIVYCFSFFFFGVRLFFILETSSRVGEEGGLTQVGTSARLRMLRMREDGLGITLCENQLSWRYKNDTKIYLSLPLLLLSSVHSTEKESERKKMSDDDELLVSLAEFGVVEDMQPRQKTAIEDHDQSRKMKFHPPLVSVWLGLFTFISFFLMSHCSSPSTPPSRSFTVVPGRRDGEAASQRDGR